jgi:hypothetical protein
MKICLDQDEAAGGRSREWITVRALAQLAVGLTVPTIVCRMVNAKEKHLFNKFTSHHLNRPTKGNELCILKLQNLMRWYFEYFKFSIQLYLTPKYFRYLPRGLRGSLLKIYL